MSTQRSVDGRRGRGTDGVGSADVGSSDGTTRRGFLTALGGAGATTVAAGVSGCVGSMGSAAGTDGSDSSGSDGDSGGGRPISVLAAGSLQLAFSEGFRAAVDRPVQVEAHGSVTVARLVAEGRRDPDVVALADTALFDRVLPAEWHAEFATNALVVAHTDSDAGRRVAEADRWFDPVADGAASLGRTDPDLDPLGYRTLFALDLASEYYDRPGLGDALVDPRQVYPETSLLSRFETGDLDAAVVYRSMAEDRGYDYVDLPAEIDLSDPDHAEAYGAVSYDLPDGETVRGAPITYGAVAREDGDRVAETFETLVGGEYLGDHGFVVPEGFPEYSGDVPRVHRP
ncbi:sulfate/thiosulfate/molybdate ABC transporter substrate-binding protein [Halosimplex carlsbadense 2-9-1]|uniref:Sulfate/thiosulfate/molybdate ABC transporter substrate-binding protein n=1 Tax=Halosimplex carlsbadense 2-9-1 TaxID=797114 RepID=M0CLX6_9EURY|nr:extracellular solute-binding protein [Halosimplex carlsbadense]ELZ23623.1 sulfate/thiosulfate/molybdate ABC transporter substrate-binding protein [Halosimplex carlsbadense 2-9-1]